LLVTAGFAVAGIGAGLIELRDELFASPPVTLPHLGYIAAVAFVYAICGLGAALLKRSSQIGCALAGARRGEGPIAVLRASAERQRWLSARGIGSRGLVTITLRGYGDMPERNSNIEAWSAFARGFDPGFPDIHSEYRTNNRRPALAYERATGILRSGAASPGRRSRRFPRNHRLRKCVRRT
jgi:hypothetical protein